MRANDILRAIGHLKQLDDAVARGELVRILNYYIDIHTWVAMCSPHPLWKTLCQIGGRPIVTLPEAIYLRTGDH